MADRNPLTDPQPGDCILTREPAPASIHILHRRDPYIWFASAHFPIRSSTVAAFVETLRMADAEAMDLTEEQKWPTPRVPHA